MRSRVIAIVTSLALLGIGCVGLHEFQYRGFRDALPGELAVSRLVDIGREPGLLNLLIVSYLIGMPADSCGAALFELTAETKRRIDAGGLGFLATARESRSASAGQRLAYDEWRPTPLPKEWLSVDSDWLWTGVVCAGLDRNMKQQLRAAAVHPGGYYSRSHRGATLVVFPEHALVIYSWWD